MSGWSQKKGTDRTLIGVIDQLDQGWSTRSFPHLISERQLYVADNVVFNRDGLVSKRPGNIFYGKSAAGATGSGAPVIAGARFYAPGQAPQLLVQSGGGLYSGNDTTGAFTLIASGFSTTQPAQFAQVYDPDMTTGAAAAMLIVDGTRIPQLYDGTNQVPVQTGGDFLPENTVTSVPLIPKYVQNWKYHLVYAGDEHDPTGVYIGDALRPERFTGISLNDSTGESFLPYYPAGRGGNLGIITGIKVIGSNLIVFFTNGIVVGYNTGTYGSYEFEWNVLSSEIGCPSPQSIVAFGGYVLFYAGDRFCATDGNAVVPIPDEIPSVYANGGNATFPAEIKNNTTVVGARRGLQYLASYDNVGTGPQTSVVCFDIGAAGGWSFGAMSGGAWSRFPSGMPIAFGIECRGPGEADFPFFWGSSLADQVAQWDTGNYDDFGMPITMEARCKAFFLDRPTGIKQIKSVSIVSAFPIPFGTGAGSYDVNYTGYVFLDSKLAAAPPKQFTVTSGEVFYDGTTLWDGSATYGANIAVLTAVGKTWPSQDAQGHIVQPGCYESSTSPFNIIAFVVELINNEPI